MPNSLTGAICLKTFPCGWVAAFPERRRGHAAGLSRRRSGWLLYGRGLDKRRLTAWQRELGAALVIVASGWSRITGDPSGRFADSPCDATGA